MLTSIDALDKPLATFWMNTAYRVPKGKFAFADRFLTQESDASTPITEMVVNSIITNVKDGQKVAVGQDVEVRGIAWDGGYGIRSVDVSTDGGRTWATAELGPGSRPLFVSHLATMRSGRPKRGRLPRHGARDQPAGLDADRASSSSTRAGYHNNVMQRIVLVAA